MLDMMSLLFNMFPLSFFLLSLLLLPMRVNFVLNLEREKIKQIYKDAYIHNK